jgi:TP901 family phage tail tape measure protein
MAGVTGGAMQGGAAAVIAGQAAVKFVVHEGEFNRGLARIEARMKQLGRAASSLGLMMAGAGIAAAPVVRAYVLFDDAIRTAGARSEATAAEFARLTEVARELGMTTSFTAVEVANLMTELAQGGADPAAIEAMTKPILDLARAAGTDAATAAKQVSVILNSFKLEAAETTRIVDGLTAAANKSFSSVEDMGFSLQYAAKTAKDANLSVEQTLAVLGGLANVGIKGEMAGTTLRRMLLLTGAEAKKMGDIFGVDPADAAGKMRPIVDVLDDVMQSLKGLTDVERTGKLEEFFGILGVTGALSVGEAALDIRRLHREILAAGGIAARTAKFMDGGLGGSFRRLRGAAEGLAISLGGALSPALTMIGFVLKQAATGLSDFVSRNREGVAGIAVAVGLAAGALAAFVGTVLTLGAAFKVVLLAGTMVFATLSAGFTALSLAAGVILTPLGLFVTALAGLAFHWARNTAAGQKMFGELAAGFRRFADDAATSFGAIGAAIAKGDVQLAWDVVVAHLRYEWTEVVAFWTEKWHGFKAEFLDGIADIIDAVVRAGKALKDALGVETVGGAATRVLGFLGARSLAGAAARAAPAVIRGGATVARFAGPIGLAVGTAAAFVPWEKVFGIDEPAGAGGGGGGGGPDPVDPRVKAARDAAAAARAELERLRAAALGDPLAAIEAGEQARVEAELARHAEKAAPKLYDAVKGAFDIPAARQQFGYGDKLGDRAVNAAEATAKNTAKTAAELVNLTLALRLR